MKTKKKEGNENTNGIGFEVQQTAIFLYGRLTREIEIYAASIHVPTNLLAAELGELFSISASREMVWLDDNLSPLRSSSAIPSPLQSSTMEMASGTRNDLRKAIAGKARRGPRVGYTHAKTKTCDVCGRTFSAQGYGRHIKVHGSNPVAKAQ